ncbi:unnamed protein product [Cuscuta epithymum]|uniref:FHA domain-containing protein n=1 Tax=Cuscuta epithymum TaxID=186058 RepID=A0AAV0FA46_9ASTE|nr:unnamed protein product [Cuscuta epithymum]CAH9132410.1 unnamed protein product [Cuscuta epithymum]
MYLSRAHRIALGRHDEEIVVLRNWGLCQCKEMYLSRAHRIALGRHDEVIVVLRNWGLCQCKEMYLSRAHRIALGRHDEMIVVHGDVVELDSRMQTYVLGLNPMYCCD